MGWINRLRLKPCPAGSRGMSGAASEEERDRWTQCRGAWLIGHGRCTEKAPRGLVRLRTGELVVYVVKSLPELC